MSSAREGKASMSEPTRPTERHVQQSYLKIILIFLSYYIFSYMVPFFEKSTCKMVNNGVGSPYRRYRIIEKAKERKLWT